jgi:hypothetical protein
MAKIGGQLGNNNAGKARIWSDALRFACLKDKTRLKKLAEILVQKACEGDMAALKELGDRLEGKPAQALIGGGSDDPPITVKEILIRAVDAEPQD